MAETDKQRAPPMPEAGGLPDQSQMAASNRRALRAEDLSEAEVAAIEASEMEPGFEHLDAELDQAGMSVVDIGLDFARNLRARGDAAKGRPADKAFCDRLFDDS
ncbi:MAG: prevent-host-death protein [Pseudomonadota bacterium]